MIALLLALMFIIVSLVEGENPLTYPIVWILGGAATLHLLARSRRQHEESPISLSSEVEVGAKPDLDMFHGLHGWTESECPPEVATAACSLSGRDPAYVRALLVMGTVRGDHPGQVVAAAARRLLRPAHD